MASSSVSAQTLDTAALLGVRQRWSRRLLPPALAALACAAWSAVALAGAGDLVPEVTPYVDWLLLLGPLAVLVMALVARPHSPTWLTGTLAWTVTFAAAVESALHIGTDLILGVAPALLVLTAVAVHRWRVSAVFLLFALAGSYGSLEAFTPVSAGITTDVLLGAGWMALAWDWLTGRREPPRWLPLPLVLLLGYVAVTAIFVIFSGEVEQAAYSFRASAWLMTGAVLIAYLLPEPRQHELAHKLVLVVAALVGAYAMLRWAIGPAAKEEEPLLNNPYAQDESTGEVRLIGSLPDPHSLGIWCATMVPFTIASVLAPMAIRWRLVALAAAGMLGGAIQGSDSRAAIVGAVVGSIAVLVLFAAARSFKGRKALPLALGFILLLAGGGVFAVTKLADEGSAGARFRSLLDPIHDESLQGRLNKWATLLDDIEQLPFGHGLGASGAAEVKYARFTSAATFDPDSSYVKVAYDQGMLVLLLFVAMLIALILGLGTRVIRAPGVRGGVLAVGACGAIASFTTTMGAGVYFESLLAATPWFLVGLAMAPYARELAHRRAPGA